MPDDLHLSLDAKRLLLALPERGRYAVTRAGHEAGITRPRAVAAALELRKRGLAIATGLASVQITPVGVVAQRQLAVTRPEARPA